MNRFMLSSLMAIALTGTGAIAACQSPSTTELSLDSSTAPSTDAPADESGSTAQAPEESTPEESPDATSEASTARRSGTFVAGEHNTIGTAELVEENGSFLIAFSDDFQTIENAPDPVIILHAADDVIGSTEPPTFPLQEGEYVEIATLQSPSGAQQYPIPPDIDPAQYGSVVIWCRRFNATFAAASLQ